MTPWASELTRKSGFTMTSAALAWTAINRIGDLPLTHRSFETTVVAAACAGEYSGIGTPQSK
jgi:hypothetical protein